ncbi:5-formyltetrahydrofolate cyclo-ligase [Pectinophora gossypiella]|uniref:5-formyltetrahydrofolate cyclo-ligase n=1 Tax=Pectinophora gossypiella TaxID=13191 RepID=UPI00214E85C5|nr:5-formyltetrahydrofolate cyclo-ligase [Pectinophora gossypiella]XP_049876695.1 5-formyltetrahydrofolate cyclo-ligase [Pectinophora gossypiella]XP_049876696.1 5-formyltetrahydrofolate cyclo-ligase [Pectinophora gossypiella]XP_049876697.1 5-formyltetrahydrofolate cyclo-ligase [Pectinophora gossypiella]XP_049876698.1 5-formyltetrahydrofolate cyclo-ligase [Pectinophora gossypiella]
MGPIKPNPAKTLLRNEIAARIATLSTEEKKRQSKAVFEKVINHPYYKSSKRVALFMSTDEEVDTAPLIAHVMQRGAAAFVPQYAGGKMSMLRIEPGDDKNMAVTKHGISQHSKDQKRENAIEGGGLDLIIAPGVAFSRNGGRVGHGGGYYDKFIASLRANPEKAPKVVAIAFSCQVVDEVPMDEQDQKIDDVICAD